MNKNLIKQYVIKEGIRNKKTYKVNLVLLKKNKNGTLTEFYFEVIGKYPKFLLDYEFGKPLLKANKNSLAFDKRMYIGDVDYILEEIINKKTKKNKKNKKKTKKNKN